MKHLLIFLYLFPIVILSQQKENIEELEDPVDQFEEDYYFYKENNEKLNLNSANEKDLESLFLNARQIQDILDFRRKTGLINSIEELLKLPSITIQDIHIIRDFIILEKPKVSIYEKDLKKASYKLGRWIANEGSTEGLSEIWLDRFFEPENINYMNYDDLMALPNLSPIDATAVLKQRNRGYINGTFELKNSPGISYWGYKNLIDFVRFKDKSKEEKKVHFRINTLFRTIPITSNPDDDDVINAFKDTSQPEQFYKISMTSPINLKVGLSYHRYMGQPNNIYTLKGFLQFNKRKVNKAIQIDKFILGNFTTSFGQGVIFETNDDFSPRRTGLGFSKRAEGVHGDLTRSCQYIMQGAAWQISTPKFRTIMFASYHPRDAIINDPTIIDSILTPNGDSLIINNSFSTMIVMQPRLPFGVTGDSTKIFHSLIESINELTWGGNIRFTPQIGHNIGFTFYESLYDRYHIPKIKESITGGDPDYSGDDYYLNYITNSADAEIASMDTSIASSPIWPKAKSFFRARGFDFSSVFGNISVHGEYGEMLKDNQIFNFGRSPSAIVTSIYAQFANFNILALYRNYDLEYDNPYQRSFSNYQRYKTSILEDSYWLVDPIYSYLYSGNPQPQAEEGFFISSRFQLHRSFITILNWDTWNRKSDNTKYFRTVATLEWRPAFNFRIKLRQKWQARGKYNIDHPSPFFSRESRVQARLRMSRFNQIEILYSNSYTTFSPRPRLTTNSLGGNMMIGAIGSPDETIGISVSHNADETFSIKGGIIYVQGFLWYFEDTDFRIFSTDNGSIHSWTSFDLKPSALFRIMLKVSYTIDAPSTKITDAQTSHNYWIKNPYTTSEKMSYRLQISYAL